MRSTTVEIVAVCLTRRSAMDTPESTTVEIVAVCLTFVPVEEAVHIYDSRN